MLPATAPNTGYLTAFTAILLINLPSGPKNNSFGSIAPSGK